MSGNVPLEKADPQSTNTFLAASDVVAGAQVQLVKLVLGDADTAQRLDDAHRMPVAVEASVKASLDSVGAGIGAPADAEATVNGTVIGLLKRLRTLLSGTLGVSAASLPLPSGAATEATLAQVRDSIRAQIDIASTVWTDNSGAFYVRRDSVDQGTGAVTVEFTTPDGTAATPGAGLRPLSTLDRDVTQALFDATSGGTGYSLGDLLARVLIIDANASPANVTAIWVNLTTGAVIAAPTGGTIERADESIGARQVGTWDVNVAASALPVGAATEATLAALKTTVESIEAATAAIQSAVVLINSKTFEVDTANVTGTVAVPGVATAANQTTINNSLSSINGKLPSLSNGRLPVEIRVPISANASITELSTSTTGSTFVAFGNAACTSMQIVNPNAASIEYRRNGAGSALTILPNTSAYIVGITNSNQISIRRADSGNTQIVVEAELYS